MGKKKFCKAFSGGNFFVNIFVEIEPYHLFEFSVNFLFVVEIVA